MVKVFLRSRKYLLIVSFVDYYFSVSALDPFAARPAVNELTVIEVVFGLGQSPMAMKVVIFELPLVFVTVEQRNSISMTETVFERADVGCHPLLFHRVVFLYNPLAP